MSRVYLDQNVFDAALERINRLFDDFEEVIVATSGGKDSTIIFNLTMLVAEQRGRLPLSVMFLDQEGEWASTIEQIKLQMYDPRVTPYWFQCPFRMTNSTSEQDAWLWCWREGDDWIHPQDPISIKENIMGSDRFHEMLTVFPQVYFPDTLSAMIGGVRAEESPGRALGLTTAATWKDITWGQYKGGKAYTFAPIYDWTWRDVWKAIHDNHWTYSSLYDSLWQYGTQPMRMRVSNVHHETALDSLTHLKEIEPETWDRIAARLQGINTYRQQALAYECPDRLPPMFAGWRQYRDYLLAHLITDDFVKRRMLSQFKGMDSRYREEAHDEMIRIEIDAILVNDWYGTKLAQWSTGPGRKYEVRHGSKRDRYSFNPKNGLTKPEEDALAATLAAGATP